jgi:hypothetical protein
VLPHWLVTYANQLWVATPNGVVQTATFQTLVKVERSILSKRLEPLQAAYKYHSYIEIKWNGLTHVATVAICVLVNTSNLAI